MLRLAEVIRSSGGRRDMRVLHKIWPRMRPGSRISAHEHDRASSIGPLRYNDGMSVRILHVYQTLEAVSLDRASVWKAGVVIGVFEVWISFIALEILNLTDAAFSHSALFVFVSLSTVYALSYYAFNYHNRWKHYAAQFSEYTRKQLVIGRILVVLCSPIP